MKTKTTIIVLIISLLFAMCSQVAFAGQYLTMGPGVEVLTVAQGDDVDNAETSEKSPDFWCKKGVTVGAAASAGFVIGSVIPGVGNILGGVVGGVIGFFAHRKRNC